MSEQQHSASEQQRVAHWLQQIVTIPTHASTNPLLMEDYHIHFYQQLPDFVQSLLQQDSASSERYAPLLFHLAGCSVCYATYIELYYALAAATQPDAPRMVIDQSIYTLATTPVRAIADLSILLIQQAEAVLRQSRHDHSDATVQARSLLQQALRLGAHISQSDERQRALHDLVRVATLFAGDTTNQRPATHSYAPALASSTRQGKVLRRADTLARSSQTTPIIYLQANALDGSITQATDGTLELHLQDLDKTLRGHAILITIPLGGLLEPVRWLGGNPNAICSMMPVDTTGSLTTPLGHCELHLQNTEDRSLLEAMFLLLEVRAAA